MDGDDLLIGELQAEYVVGEDDDIPVIRRRFDRLLPTMAEECARHLGGLPESAVVIDRLNVNVVLDAGADDATVAREWGLALAEAIRQATGRPSGPGLARFSDEGEYVAAFLDDLGRGGAWVPGRYQSLIPLQRANRGDTIVAVLQYYRRFAWRILCDLHRRGRLESLLNALTEEQTMAVARGLAPARPPVAWPHDNLDSIGSLWPRVWPLLDRPLTSPANWIRLVTWMISEDLARADDPSIACLSAEALRLSETLEGLGERPDGRRKTVERLMERLTEIGTDGTAPPEVAAIGDRLAQLGLGLQARPPGPVRVRLGRLLSRAGPEGVPEASRKSGTDTKAPVLTHAGGFFLLIRDLLESDIPTRVAAVPSVDGIPGDRLGLYVLALALAGPRVQQVRRDAGAALFAGLEGPPAPAILERAAAGTDPTVLLQGPQDPDATAVIVPHDSGPVLVVRDADGEWRFAARVEDGADAGDILAACSQRFGVPACTVPWADEPVLQRDVSHLLATRLPEVPEPVHAAFAVLARRLLARFARRLSGFAGSSAPYIMTNFLYGPSTIEVGEAVVHVTLPRTPLQVVLRLFGTGEVAAVPWLAGRRLTFTFA